MFLAELNNDQRRETVNTRQRFAAWREAVAREQGYRGSMVWDSSGGAEYLLRSFYDENNVRRQKSLGRRQPETEAIKERFVEERERAVASRKNLDAALERQAGINRALGLGRIPLTAARILRIIGKRGLMGAGIRVAGTNALYVYEATCGVFVDAEITATTDIDLLFDARRRLFLIAEAEFETRNLVDLLKLADRSFTKTRQSFRARNQEGYLVDLIKPRRDPPWLQERQSLGDPTDLQAAEIEGLAWLENSPAFEQVVIDERGFPLRIVAPDPRVFAIHKFWISQREDRDPLKRRRDHDQAQAVALMLRGYLQHLPLEPSELRMVPRAALDEFLDRFGS